jgi:two-component system response regulator
MPTFNVNDPKTILLVEDNPDDEQLTLRALRTGYVANLVRVARDGAEAIKILFAQPDNSLPDLVILDIQLPYLNGLEVLKQIRENPTTRYLPVVILTSSDEDRDIQTAFEYGANSYVKKPVDFNEFQESVRQLGVYWLNHNRFVMPVAMAQ